MQLEGWSLFYGITKMALKDLSAYVFFQQLSYPFTFKWNEIRFSSVVCLSWDMLRNGTRRTRRTRRRRRIRGHCGVWNAWLAAWPLASWLSICEGQSLHWADLGGQEICSDVWNELNMNWEWIETIRIMWNTKLTSDGNCGKLWYQDVAHLGILIWW